VVGAGTRFLSAMSYYTIRLTNALAGRFAVTIMPMRQLLPTFLYPGRSRVGLLETRLEYDPDVRVLSGVDWFWIPSLFRNLAALLRSKPDVVVFEWWTGTVLHTYLAVAILARLQGAVVLIELHEILDSGEERMWLARTWVRALGPPFFRLASGFVIHSEEDRIPVDQRYHLRGRPCVLIHHGPYDHHVPAAAMSRKGAEAAVDAPRTLNLLFLGVIRPYKGLEDLVAAFSQLDEREAARFHLTVVGETWEGWDKPLRDIERSPHRDRITVVNRFVDDDEVAAQFAAADAVVLPYHRSSASGPAHAAMSNGLPLIVTEVGGLPAAVAGYDGAILVPPHNPTRLQEAILQVSELAGRRYTDPHSWDETVARYERLIDQIRARYPEGTAPSTASVGSPGEIP
jgi:glycosyltransferase involved in cell wall biosynthesis